MGELLFLFTGIVVAILEQVVYGGERGKRFAGIKVFPEWLCLRMLISFFRFDMPVSAMKASSIAGFYLQNYHRNFAKTCPKPIQKGDLEFAHKYLVIDK